jgi:hypothetical protein
MSEPGKDLRQSSAGELSGSGRHQINAPMREKEADQFLTGVAGSADNRHVRLCHNAQCVIRLARIAMNISGLFASGTFR